MSCQAFPAREGPGVPRAAVEHMPFAGHRNCAQWGNKRNPFHAAGDYGLDPELLKVACA